MERSRRDKGSRIILALDVTLDNPQSILKRSLEILESVHEHICAVKINRHLTLPLGLHNGVQRVLKLAESLDLPKIMDCKINDIGYTNRVIAEEYFKAGFDAVTANPFVGWEDGLKPVFEVSRDMNKGVLLLVYMSHKSAYEGYGQNVFDPETGKSKPQYIIFAEKALSWGADGVIVGATYPERIREVNKVLRGEVPIYSPGVGAQGGSAEKAIISGAQYIIVGRSITKSKKPGLVARDIKNRVMKVTGNK
ncbi:orotidine 5'-phosphate decarboxylase [Candidatus Bathyarchaeota archaeon]|nr:MAG: orotidine 5'-phosphate decarboxylase [Candidatus Bathyarchaeota archaeon]